MRTKCIERLHDLHLYRCCAFRLFQGITNEFSERKLKQRRTALLMDKVSSFLTIFVMDASSQGGTSIPSLQTACNQSNQWPILSMSSGLQEPMCQHASSPEDRCAVHHHHHHHHHRHFHQPIPRLSAPLRFDVASAALCPPPNVFPFSDGIANDKTNEDEDEFNAPSVIPALHMHESSIWRPFDSC